MYKNILLLLILSILFNMILFTKSICYESGINKGYKTCLENNKEDISGRNYKRNCKELACTKNIGHLQVKICIQQKLHEIVFFIMDYYLKDIKHKYSVPIFEQPEPYEVNRIALLGNKVSNLEVFLKIISVDAMYQLKFEINSSETSTISLIYIGSKEKEEEWQPFYEETNGKKFLKNICNESASTSTTLPLHTSLNSTTLTSTTVTSTTIIPSTSQQQFPATNLPRDCPDVTSRILWVGGVNPNVTLQTKSGKDQRQLRDDLNNGFIIILIFIGITLNILLTAILIILCCKKSKIPPKIESIKDEKLELAPLKNSNEIPEIGACNNNTETFDCTTDSQVPLTINDQRSKSCKNNNTNTQSDETETAASRPDEKIQVLTTFSAEYQTFKDEFLHLENKELIGEGGFGNVYKCLYMESNRYCYVAVKEPKRPSYEAFKEENIMMRIKDHPNIIKLITTRIGDNLHLVMPLLKCNLAQFLYNNSRKPSIAQRIRYCHQIAQGMTYLMFKQIVHCDLKASNILVVDENLVQISDFGKAHLMRSKRRTTGTITHTAMELLDPSTGARNSESTDIWSFGVTIWEIFNLTEQIPYKEELINVSEIRILEFLYSQKHLETKYWPPKDDSPQALMIIESYMKRCLVHNSELRPTFDKLWEIFESMLPEGQLRKYKSESEESDN